MTTCETSSANLSSRSVTRPSRSHETRDAPRAEVEGRRRRDERGHGKEYRQHDQSDDADILENAQEGIPEAPGRRGASTPETGLPEVREERDHGDRERKEIVTEARHVLGRSDHHRQGDGGGGFYGQMHEIRDVVDARDLIRHLLDQKSRDESDENDRMLELGIDQRNRSGIDESEGGQTYQGQRSQPGIDSCRDRGRRYLRDSLEWVHSPLERAPAVIPTWRKEHGTRRNMQERLASLARFQR